ncbi:MAG: cupin-like domain-containing protein [Rhodobacter sp.]|nr:cupin-like domain-containing protein [Rhodobacter sp.]
MEFTEVATETLLSPREFDDYTRPGGKPLIVRGWMQGWPAMDAWSFDFFKDTYGDDEVKLGCDAMSGDCDLVTTLADYIDYLTAEEADADLHRHHRRLGAERPFYCTSYQPFLAHPELWDDIALPPFVLDWWPYFDLEFKRSHFPHVQGWILLSPPGAVSRLHVDSHHTITLLAQLRGTKEAYLFAPEDAEAVYHGAVDPADPDHSRFPDLKMATCHRCVMTPGDMLFLPPDWWHHVVTKDHSITVSQNLVNHTNFGLYIRKALNRNLARFLNSLPPDGIGGSDVTAAGASQEVRDA